MTTTAGDRDAATSGVAAVDAVDPVERRQRWWLELLLAAGFYAAYAAVRDWHGAVSLHARALARSHGFDVLHVEQWMHLDLEKGAQTLALHARPLVVAMDVFYGTAHFLVTAAVFGWLLARASRPVFRHARNVIALSTALGLVVFALYPTMPPRLMPPGIKTIDTMDAVGGLWSYNHGVLEHISDPFAAMPSLHIVWASWVAYVFWRLLAGRGAGRARLLPWLYPVITGVVVVATGTHWVLDLFGGAALFAVAVAAAGGLQRLTTGRSARRTR
jgi:hypothetical protein